LIVNPSEVSQKSWHSRNTLYRISKNSTLSVIMIKTNWRAMMRFGARILHWFFHFTHTELRSAIRVMISSLYA